MVELEGAVLIGSGDCDKYSKINIIHPEFIVGSSESSSFVIDSGFVSKTQCIFRKTNGTWTVCDKSTCGTYVNGEKLKKDRPTTLRDGDEVAFGTANNFSTLEEEGLQKQMKETKTKENPEQQEMMDHQEKLDAQEKLLQEEKLEEMKTLLKEKQRTQELLCKKLQEKEVQMLQDLKRLQEEKDEQTLDRLEELCKEVAEIEDDIQILLERMEVMQKDEMEIEIELAKKKLELTNKLKAMQEIIQKVKRGAFNTEGKKQYLEQELDKIRKAENDAPESFLKAKQEVLDKFEEPIETEFQCSICRELLVMATILNCGHTCCRSCIVKWMEEKNNCPICRTSITSQFRSSVMDNIINSWLEIKRLR
ncbi:E3 ubiquitin-protein ligase rnf8-like isoform X2 [Zootermopsis nevadensis]|uniref:E3 ubiquitin-protein ligase rnf8-like isoform X2 n=1 Tax=Zootermopsis nevadensis TaxID=136037 RepID=UPI000B8E4A09|nr:E3 ubiquitin-protein ligase rnf8-like isoform X2 [Zootermopsis nevadensis]